MLLQCHMSWQHNFISCKIIETSASERPTKADDKNGGRFALDLFSNGLNKLRKSLTLAVFLLVADNNTPIRCKIVF